MWRLFFEKGDKENALNAKQVSLESLVCEIASPASPVARVLPCPVAVYEG